MLLDGISSETDLNIMRDLLELPFVLVIANLFFSIRHCVFYTIKVCCYVWATTFNMRYIILFLLGPCLQIACLEIPLGEGGIYEADVDDLRPALDWSLEKGWSAPLPKVTAQ